MCEYESTDSTSEHLEFHKFVAIRLVLDVESLCITL